MARKKSKPARRTRTTATGRSPEQTPEGRDLEARMRRDAALPTAGTEALNEQLAEHTGTSPRLTGGDVDADWERAASVGEEAVGGSVATPDQSVVDDLGRALGVQRAPDEEVRTSAEILAARDRNRWDDEDG
jgi:uncharacterized protein DUF6335